MSDRERKALASLPLPEFIEACSLWMEANYPGWKYGAFTAKLGVGVPMLVLPFTPSGTSRTPHQPSCER
jgi:hypothetical protein